MLLLESDNANYVKLPRESRETPPFFPAAAGALMFKRPQIRTSGFKGKRKRNK